MKKITAIILAVVMLMFVMAGCSTIQSTILNSETTEDETVLTDTVDVNDGTEQREEAEESTEEQEDDAEAVPHIHIWVKHNETVHHEAEGHYETVDVPAWDEQVLVKEAWDEKTLVKAAWDETVVDKPAWDEQVVTKPAWDEKVLVHDAYDETVCVHEAWDEQVIVKPAVTQTACFISSTCNKCGATFLDGPFFAGQDAKPYSASAHWSEMADTGDNGHSYTYYAYAAEVEIEPAVYETVHHDAEYKTVHHDTEYQTIHHDAEYKTVHHDATYKMVHHDAEYKTIHHDAEYKTVHHEATTEQQWVEDKPAWDETVTAGHRCRECGEVRDD